MAGVRLSGLFFLSHLRSYQYPLVLVRISELILWYQLNLLIRWALGCRICQVFHKFQKLYPPDGMNFPQI